MSKMETLRAQVKPEKAQLVKKIAMEQFGYEKGAISFAINEALDEWLRRKKTATKRVDWNKLRGALSNVKMTAVELQHAAWDKD